MRRWRAWVPGADAGGARGADLVARSRKCSRSVQHETALRATIPMS